MSERSGGREQSEQSGASERMSGASERANRLASGPLLQSVFLVVLNHTDALWSETNKNRDVSTGPLARPFACTAHLFACSGLLASLAPSAALTHSLARSLRSLPRSWDSEILMCQNDLVLSHSALFIRMQRSSGVFMGRRSFISDR